MTQTTSKPRVKPDNIGNGIDMLYHNYHVYDVNQFRTYCKEVVMNGTGKKEKCIAIANAIERSGYKDAILKMTNDFILAGMG